MKPFILICMSTVTTLPVTKIMQNILDRACLAGCRDVSMKIYPCENFSVTRVWSRRMAKNQGKERNHPLVTPGQTGNTEGGGDE
jgi:hypothetical protein